MKIHAFLTRHAWLLPAVLFALVALGVANPSLAQTEPTVTFGASVTSGNGSLTTRLTWSTTPAATSCTASGHPQWLGSKPSSGSQDLPAITLSGSYTLSLSCSWPGTSSAIVRWTPPTTNTDGSALAKCATATTQGACLALFHVMHATTAAGVPNGEMTPVMDPNATSFTWTGLAPGDHYFAVEVVNGNGVPSELSNIAGPKTTTGAVTKSAPITLTVNPVPRAPADVSVQ